MSRASFLLLLVAVVSITAALGGNGGVVRHWKTSGRYEAHESILSLKDDFNSVRSEAYRAPRQLHFLIQDLVHDSCILAGDVKVEVRIAARYLANLVRTRTGRG